MITYKLAGITEHSLSVTNPTYEKPNQEFMLGWDIDFNLNYPENGLLDVTIRASAIQENNEDRRPFASMVVVHQFEVEGIDRKHPQEASPQERHLLATLLGVSLGTIRGMMYARTIAVLGKNVFLPVMNPLDMLNNAFPVKTLEEG